MERLGVDPGGLLVAKFGAGDGWLIAAVCSSRMAYQLFTKTAVQVSHMAAT